jgi:hypothetical protein
VNQVDRLFWLPVGRYPIGDEQADHFAFQRLGLFANDGKVRRQLGENERAFDDVVIS